MKITTRVLRSAVPAFLGLGLLAGGAVPALAQDKQVDLKFSYWLPPAHPLVPAGQQWAESIAKASNGSIKVTVFPSEQLGKAFDHYDMARDGIADITFVNPGYQPGRFPVVGLGEIPFLVKNATGGSRAFDEWYRQYAEREMKDVKFCVAYLHDPGAFHLKKKITKPEELNGMKIRPAHATMAAFVTSLGGTNVQASAPEARDVLERGVADGITFPWASILLFGIEKAVKYHMDVPLYATTFVTVMNKARYDSMSPAQKKVMDDHCTSEWAEKIATPWANFEAEGRTKIKAMADHEVYTIGDAELAAWKKAAQPLHERWAENVKKAGQDPASIKAAFDAAMKKHGAAY